MSETMKKLSGEMLMDAIRDEMARADSDAIAQLGELMTAYLRRHPEAEADSGCTLQAAYDRMQKKARSRQKGGCYAMHWREIFAVLMEAFGLTPEPGEDGACFAEMLGQRVPDAAEAPARREAGDLDALDLDALMEGD